MTTPLPPKPKPSAQHMHNATGVSSVDNLANLYKTLAELAELEVLVGFPEDSTPRKPAPGDTGTPPNNATIAYVQDQGSPANNIPPRPFMIPAMLECASDVANALIDGAVSATKLRPSHDPARAVKVFMRAGIIAQNALRKKINEGIPPPLAKSTLLRRANRGKGRKGAQQELANREAGLAASTQLAKPLIDTGQLRNAAVYVIRKRSDRSK